MHKLSQLGSRNTPQGSWSRKFAHLGIYWSQALSQTVSPKFPGKGMRALFTLVEVARTKVARASFRTHCLAPTAHQGLGWTGFSGRPACGTRDSGAHWLANPHTWTWISALPAPVLLRTFVLLTAVRCATGGQLSPAVPETQHPKAKLCSGEGLQVCTGLLFLPAPPPSPFRP